MNGNDPKVCSNHIRIEKAVEKNTNDITSIRIKMATWWVLAVPNTLGILYLVIMTLIKQGG